jgi:triosephosphate isomerase
VAYGETNETVVIKAKNAQNCELTPIVCVGESVSEYKAKKTREAVSIQLKSLKNVLQGNVIIAYEPVWAIGSGMVPSVEEISDIHEFIKNETGHAAVYGGSVTAQNYKTIVSVDNVAGVLVGGESLNVDKFSAILC